MTRREAREQAFILLFEKSFRNETIQELIDLANESRVIVIDQPDLKRENWEMHLDPFAEQTALRVEACIEELDEHIERLSRKWKKNRISRVSISVLRLALYEMLYDPDIPVGVSINEAVDITKKYAGEEDYSFVNGVLGTAAKELVAPLSPDADSQTVGESDTETAPDEPELE